VKELRATRFTWLLLSAALVLWGGGLGAEDSIDTWIHRLEDEETRDQARDRLRDLGAKAVPALIKALGHAKPVIRSEAAFALGRIGRKEAVPPLIHVLDDKEPEVRRKVAYALGEIADPRAVDALVRALTDADAGVRANVCFAFGQIGDARPAREILKALVDEDETVRNFAASALGFTGEKRVLPALAWTALNDKSAYVRALAISSMGNLGDARACSVLIGLLEDKEYLIRARAIESLLLITHNRRTFDPRGSEASRAAAVTLWKNWYRANGTRLGSLNPQAPGEVYDWWFGKPPPKPEPKPEPKPQPKPEPIPAPVPKPEPVPEQGDRNLLGPSMPLRTGPLISAEGSEGTPAPKGVPAEAAAFFTSGLKELEAGHLESAVQAFEACVKLTPDWRDAHFDLGLCYRKLERLREAAEEYRRCLQIRATDVPAFNNLGNVYELLHRGEDAETMYRMALQVSPKDVNVRFNLAGLLFGLGKLEEARKIFEELLESGPLPEGMDVPLIRLRLAACYLRTHEEAKAVETLDRATEGSKDPFVLREAARYFFNMGKHARARDLLEQAYRESNGDAETAYLLALFLVRVPDAKLRDLDKAAIYADFAVTANANDPRYLSALAEVTHARGEKEKAVELVERALQLVPDSATLKRQLEEYRKDLPDKGRATTAPEAPGE